MTLQECTAILMPFVIAFRADFDDPTFRAYHRVLEPVHPVLLEAALQQATDASPRFFPNAVELKAAAEKVRRQQLALHPWSACCECEAHPRFREIEIDGVKRMQKCPCIDRHQQSLATYGLLEPIVLLPGEAGEADSEQVFPTIDQLPAPLQQQIRQLAGGKVLR